MKRTEVARECAAALHATEESLEATLASAKQTLERLLAAKAELGLNGTVGDACVARMNETIAGLEQALDTVYAAHREAYGVMQGVSLRTKMDLYVPTTLRAFERAGADEAKVA